MALLDSNTRPFNFSIVLNDARTVTNPANGNSYNIGTLDDGRMVVQSIQTGKYFALGFRDLIQYCVTNGLDIQDQNSQGRGGL